MTESTESVAGISLFDVDTLKHPYDVYRRLRDHAPVHYLPGVDLHVVTRYDLIRQALRDTSTYSSRFDAFLGAAQQLAAASVPEPVKAQLAAIAAEMIPLPPTLLTLDEPEHGHYRALVGQLFTASQVRKFEGEVAGTIERAIDAFIDASGSVDFMRVFAGPVPLTVIGDRLGIPTEDRTFFHDAATAAAAALRFSPVTADEMVRRARLARDLQQLLVRLIEERRARPRADMITILATSRLEPSRRLLSHAECLSILNQFLVAGHETTTSAFGWGMLILCRQPELQGRIRSEGKYVRNFVEELLRLESPVQGLPRRVTRDTTLGGQPLRGGDLVMLRYGAGNRDERQFEHPDEVDLLREKAGMQLAFGSGIHHCIGAPLARQELTLGFTALLARTAHFRLASGVPEPEAEPSFILRNLAALHITFERRQGAA